MGVELSHVGQEASAPDILLCPLFAGQTIFSLSVLHFCNYNSHHNLPQGACAIRTGHFSPLRRGYSSGPAMREPQGKPLGHPPYARPDVFKFKVRD
ncbi:MAG: hypothetical protein RQ760_21945 [Sedimentisphaerales bacterium]|nr:hypothetical protein [Sedimentisphaerales bacterium]